jgi:hypothetical protein
MGFSEEIDSHLDNKEDHELPKMAKCSSCGGSVMTPSYDFNDMEEAY